MRCSALGKLKKIAIEHDNTGFCPGWFLDYVTMADGSKPEKLYYFNCGQWLAKDEGNGEIKKDIVASDTYSSQSSGKVEAVITGQTDRTALTKDLDIRCERRSLRCFTVRPSLN
jgi:hypothetical protein